MRKIFGAKMAPINISINQTNFIKGIGILMIVFHNFFHWVKPSTGENEFDFWNQRVVSFFKLIGENPSEIINLSFSFLGHFGVQLFIFISGYGLAKSYLNKKPGWGTFLQQRIIKIYPSLLVGIAVLWIYTIITKSSLPGDVWWYQISLKLLMIHTIIPGESLSINGPWWFFGLIFQLYLLFPILYKVLNRWGVRGFVVLNAAAYVLIYTLYTVLKDEKIFIMANAPGHIPEFALGIFLAMRPKMQIRKVWLWVAGLVFAVGNYKFNLYPFTFIAISFLLVPLLLSWANKYSDLRLKQSWIVKYGQLSMFVFAVHGFFRPPFVTLARSGNSPLLTIGYALLFFVTITGVALASEAGYSLLVKWIEKVHQWIDRVYNKKWVQRFLYKNHINDTLSQFVKYWMFAILSIVSIRLLMMLWLKLEYSVVDGDYRHLFYGIFREIIVLSRISGWVLIPLLLVGTWLPKLCKTLNLIFFIGFLIITAGLSYYYLNTQVPLDGVIMAFSTSEMLTIISTSGGFNLWSYLFLLVPIFSFLMFSLNFQKIHMTRVFLVIILISVFTSNRWISPSEIKYDNDQQYYKSISFSAYLLNTVSSESDVEMLNNDVDYGDMAKLYQTANPELEMVNANYPFFHQTNYPDVLSEQFNFKEGEKPNFVFIIVESLGSAYSGSQAKGISVTPFIDSLSRHSLYWPNCLSSSERTFGVLPGLFSSFPSFADMRNNMPVHYSMLQKLDSIGYKNSFYYGGDANFDGMLQYMKFNAAEMPISNTDASVGTKSENPYNNWGWDDQSLFDQRISRVPIEKDSAFVDVYLTLSSHAPFLYPDKEEWENKVEKYISTTANHNPLSEVYKKHIEPLAAIHFADNSIRSIIEFYKKSDVWENTIFIITGDHHIGVLPRLSAIDIYNVPLIIYSPKLAEGKINPAVVSHFDIAPSLMSFVKNQTLADLSDFSHCLGTGLDTSRIFSSHKKIPFLRINRKIVDYLSNDYYISKNRLFRVSEDLKLTKLSDEDVLNKVEQEVNNVRILNHFAVKQNRIIPREYQANRKDLKVFRKIEADFENGKVPNDFSAKNITEENPISGQASAILSEKLKYGSLVPYHTFKENYRQIELLLRFDYTIPDIKKVKLPSVVFQLVNKNETIWYKMHKLKSLSDECDENGVYHFSVSDNYRTEDYVAGAILKVFLYNGSNSCLIYDNIKCEIIAKP
ncbi:MAG: acyltransferase family protein [Bacteroidales bacterium]|nr:acyltransferase family protein [Bacteroidales bacterium]